MVGDHRPAGHARQDARRRAVLPVQPGAGPLADRLVRDRLLDAGALDQRRFAGDEAPLRGFPAAAGREREVARDRIEQHRHLGPVGAQELACVVLRHARIAEQAGVDRQPSRGRGPRRRQHGRYRDAGEADAEAAPARPRSRTRARRDRRAEPVERGRKPRLGRVEPAGSIHPLDRAHVPYLSGSGAVVTESPHRDDVLRCDAHRLPVSRLEALWHDLECGAYGEDLPLWRALAGEAGGPVLDVGAGTGRVSARPRRRRRAGGRAGHRRGAAGGAGSTAPRGCRSRRSSPTRASSRWAAGSRWCSCRCRRCSCSEGRAGARRSCAARWITSSPAGWWPPRWPTRWTASTTSTTRRRRPTPARSPACATPASCVAVVDEGGRAAIHRRREIIGPGGAPRGRGRRGAAGPGLGARRSRRRPRGSASSIEPDRSIPETEEYLGSTVVVLRAPR